MTGLVRWHLGLLNCLQRRSLGRYRIDGDEMIFRRASRMLAILLLVTASSGIAQELHAPGYVRRDAAPDAAADRVVVFVHGLSSRNGDNAVSTWTPEEGLPWPLLLTHSEIFRDQDIYVANYDSDAWNGRSFTSVSGDLARQLRGRRH